MSDPTPSQPAAAPVVAEQPKPAAPAPTATATTPPTQGDPAEAPLGEKGLSALREERAARERLEQAMKDQRTALLKAFGVESDKGGEDIVKTLQEQVSAMQRDSLVDRMARRHGITDDDDVAFLRTASDEATMQRLAERLKASNTGPASPAPDPSQASAPLSPEAAQEAEYGAFFPTSSK